MWGGSDSDAYKKVGKFLIAIFTAGVHLKGWNVLHDLSTSPKVQLRYIDDCPVEVLSTLQGRDPRVHDDHRVEAARTSAPPEARSLPEETCCQCVVGSDADPTWVVDQ